MTVRALLIGGVVCWTLSAAFAQTEPGRPPALRLPGSQAPGSAGTPQSGAASTGPLYYLQALSPGAIRIVQSKLREAGVYTGPVDGNWNSEGAQALQNFQSSHELQTTGQINLATAIMLGLDPVAMLSGAAGSAGAPPSGASASASTPEPAPSPPSQPAGSPPSQPAGPPPSQSAGPPPSPPPGPPPSPEQTAGAPAPSAPSPPPVPLSPNDVRALQARLAQAGAYRGRVDGVWGGRSQQALMRFQQMQGLPVTGRIDATTVQALGFDPKHFVNP